MRLQEAERDRIFCNHTLSHFLDVARLMYLYALTDQVGLEKHLIYAAALLHDIGRYEQISIGTPHEQASAALAAKILPECGYTKSEIAAIRLAILGHRREPTASGESLLSVYLRRADKQSRCCFACQAADQCYWPSEKRNSQISL